MRRVQLLLIFCLLAALGLGIWWRRGRLPESAFVGETDSVRPSPEVLAASRPASDVPTPTVQGRGAPLPVTSVSPPLSVAPPDLAKNRSAPRLKRAYVLQLDAGKLTLMAQEDIEGDFAPPPHTPEVWSGMLRCLLLRADGSVAGEEILPAPDHLCTVLDAQAGGTEPVHYTVAGPAIFQLRLPRVAGAARLMVTRIGQPDMPATDTVLGTINLSPL